MGNNVSAAIQVVPVGIVDRVAMYSYIVLAIEIIKDSKLPYLVTPFETTIEGKLEDILNLFKKINIELHKKGVKTLCMNIKIWSGDIGSTEEKLKKYQI